MNALTCLKSALQQRNHWIFNTLAAAGALLLGACSPQDSYSSGSWGSPGRNNSAPQSSDARSASPLATAAEPAAPGRSVSAAEAFAKPAKERPGLATQWGNTVRSPLGDTRFTRASARPYGIDMIYYNDAEGLKAMGARDYRVDGMQEAAGGVLEWGVRGGFGMLPAYKAYGSGRRAVEGRAGGTYSIVVKNRCKSRIMVVLSVDGLDVMDGKPAGVSRPGYVVNAGQTLEIQGFRTGYDTVAAFRFSSVSGSYAQTRHGDTRNVGVIGLAAFLEKGSDPWTWMPAEIQKRDTANPFATAR